MKKNLDTSWQDHLDHLDAPDSANYHFIRLIREQAPEDLLSAINDFAVTPLVDEENNRDEGQLPLDVYETEADLVVKAFIAGADPASIELFINDDILTIRGERTNPDAVENYYYQENFWGRFSRSIVLPLPVAAPSCAANLKNGLLTIILPKIQTLATVKVEVDLIE
jgi:HSP20 family protein